MGGWEEAIARITRGTGAQFGGITINPGDILLAGEEVELIQVPPGSLPEVLFENRGRITTTVCYCWVFGR